MKPESVLWDYLRPRLPIGIHYSRIESDTSTGFPDVHYTLETHSGTIELKSQPNPTGDYPFSGEKKGLRKAQKSWIREELAAGGHVTLVLQLKDSIFFLDGHRFEDLDNMTESDLRAGARLIWEKGRPIQPVLLRTILQCRLNF